MAVLGWQLKSTHPSAQISTYRAAGEEVWGAGSGLPWWGWAGRGGFPGRSSHRSLASEGLGGRTVAKNTGQVPTIKENGEGGTPQLVVGVHRAELCVPVSLGVCCSCARR